MANTVHAANGTTIAVMRAPIHGPIRLQHGHERRLEQLVVSLQCLETGFTAAAAVRVSAQT